MTLDNIGQALSRTPPLSLLAFLLQAPVQVDTYPCCTFHSGDGLDEVMHQQHWQQARPHLPGETRDMVPNHESRHRRFALASISTRAFTCFVMAGLRQAAAQTREGQQHQARARQALDHHQP